MIRRVVAVAVAIASLSACGNAVTTDVNGQTAITVDDEGNLVVLVAVCHSSIDQVTIAADREGLKETEENPILGTWTASKPQKGLVTLSLADPGSPWQSSSTFVPADAKGYIVIGARTDADVEATQVYFHGGDVAGLTPDDVIVEDAKVQKRSTFEKVCDEDSGSSGGY
ncbi:MAG: hypothetical protein ABIN55_11935 [Aeromicrobium sp.]